MEFKRTNSFQKQKSQTPQPTTRFGSRPFAAPVQMKPKEQQTPEELENEAFDQNKFEAFGLQLKEKSDTITPVEQERLGLLQAKMNDFWEQRRERASRSGFDFSKVSVTPPGEPAAPQLQPMGRLGTPGELLGGDRLLFDSPQHSSASPLQTKLTIGQSGDQYEQEADRVASQVVAQINTPASASSTQGRSVQRQEEELEEELQTKPEITALQRQQEESEEELQTKPEITALQRQQEEPEELQAKSTLQRRDGMAGGDASTDLESAINSARGSGQPLDADLQRTMGQAIGADFSGVKVHTDAQSDQLNQSIQAKAFTTGQDVFFRQGAYDPGSRGGQELIAHELTHVVQQSGGAVRRSPLPAQQHLQHAANVTKSTSGGERTIQRMSFPEYEDAAKKIQEAPREAYELWDIVQTGQISAFRGANTLQQLVEKVETYVAKAGDNASFGKPLRSLADKSINQINEYLNDLKRIPVNIEIFKDDALVVKEFVTAEHKKAISTYCKNKNVILSVRDTGKLSLDRLEEGAKPKPHTILEKSIKKSSLAEAHPQEAEALSEGVVLDVPPTIGGVSLDDLKGFVGHWKEDTRELLGVRVAPKDVELGEERTEPKDAHSKGIRALQPFLEGRNTNKPYIPLSKFAGFCAAFPDGKWKHFLYTGDYDLHEVYKHNKALVEGSKDKARVLTGINEQIAKDQLANEPEGASPLPLRKGKLKADGKTAKLGERTVPASTIHADEDANYAMIQHGDQMGYITNQIHEGRLKEQTKNDKAQLVEAVAEESPGSLAWCVRGDWYVTQNKVEHSAFRGAVGLTASSGWGEKSQKAMRDGSSRTTELKKPNPTKIGVDSADADRPWIKNKGNFEPGNDEHLPE